MVCRCDRTKIRTKFAHMTTGTLYQRNGIWHYRRWDNDKRREFRVSLKTRDREEAERIAADIVVPVQTQRDPEIRKMTAQMICDRETVAADAKRAASMRLSDVPALQPYRGAKRTLSEATQKMVSGVWRTLLRYCEGHGIETVGQLTSRHAEAFLALHGAGRYASNAHIVLRRWFGQLGAHPNPWEPELRPKVSANSGRHREALTMDEVARLLDYADTMCKAPDMPTFVRFLLYTGLRLGDAATARVSDVDFTEGMLRKRTSKTGRVVEFPIHPDLLPRLRREGEYLFPDACHAYRHGTLTGRFKRIFRRLDFGGEPGEHCAHCLRTTFASICARNGVPLPVIQSWLGHSTAAITRIYARVEDREAKRAAMASFPPLGRA